MAERQKIIVLETEKNVTKIYHLADIHIPRDNTRYKEYDEVINRALNEIKKDTGESLIVLCGDIVDFKTNVTNEAVRFTGKFLLKLAELTDVIIIAGNHDTNIGNVNILDTLQTVLTLIQPKNKIHYLRNSGLYNYSNIIFSVTSLFDKTLIRANTIQRTNDTILIALYHGFVFGSELDIGYIKNDDAFKKDDFNGYDYVLLGDIHKHQYLDENKTMAYPSSLVQKTHQESLNDHGYIKWDLLNKTSEFVRIPNDYGFISLTVENGHLVNYDETCMPKYPKIRMNFIDTTRKDKDKIISELEKKYNTKINLYGKTEDKITISINTNENQKIIPKNKNYINQLITNYCSQNKNLQNKIHEILLLNNRYLDKLNIDSEINVIRWKIIEVEFSNLLSYGENNKINLEKNKALIGLFADNKHGKSNIIDIILFILFDRSTRGTKNEMINHGSNNFKASMIFESNGTRYKINRKGIIANKEKRTVTSQVELFKIVNLDVKLIASNDKNDTNKKIIELVGSYDDVLLTSIMTFNNEYNFLQNPQARRKELLINMLRLDMFEKIHELVKIDYNKINCELNNLLNEKKLLENKITRINFTKSDKIKKKELLKEKDSLKHKIDTVEKKNHQLMKNINPTKSRVTFNTKITKDEIHKKIDSLTNQLNEKTQLKSKLTSQNEELYESNDTIFELNDKIKRNKEIISDLQQNKKVNTVFIPIDKLIKERKKLRDELRGKRSHARELTTTYFETQILLKLESELEYNKILNERIEYFNKQHRLQKDQKDILIQLKEKETSRLNELYKFKFNPNCEECKNNPNLLEKLNLEKSINITNRKIEKCENNIQNFYIILSNDEMPIDDIQINQYIKRNIDTKNKLNNIDLTIKETNLIIKDIENKIKNIDEQRAQFKKNQKIFRHNNKIDNQILQLQQENNELEDEKNTQFIKQNNWNNKLKILEKEIIETNELKEKYESTLILVTNDELTKNITKNKNSISLHKNALKKIKNMLDIINKKENDHYDTCKELEKCKEQLIDVTNSEEEYRNYLSVLDKNGLPLSILTTVLPEIQNNINHILSLITDFTIRMKLKDNSIIVKKIQDNIKTTITYSSGFESFIISLSFKIILGKISNTINNFFIIDEGFSCFDDENINKLKSVLEYLKENYDFTIIISHDDILKNNCTDTMLLNKIDNRSKIVY